MTEPKLDIAHLDEIKVAEALSALRDYVDAVIRRRPANAPPVPVQDVARIYERMERAVDELGLREIPR